jgi:hypothetical protein
MFQIGINYFSGCINGHESASKKFADAAVKHLCGFALNSFRICRIFTAASLLCGRQTIKLTAP